MTTTKIVSTDALKREQSGVLFLKCSNKRQRRFKKTFRILFPSSFFGLNDKYFDVTQLSE